jgi:hypothetical protein
MNDVMTAEVTDLSGGKFKVTYSFAADYDGKLLEFKEGGQTYYVYEVGATSFKTKTTDEKTGMTLYFEITMVGYQ